ncbi:uncharacterized protein LOC120927821 isoform X1 [Rana temporaria]|uniref:uncharacterized protein LOC120927816 isoform X1 n=1 Tax=Rana temporaria TaxID=8407 RepID=UPI001AACCBAD|nr:uncharacterized protein LOC120927816 isoform X1 [Rana temporaria]XP_040194676.1 uncharacterized protein LOC120927821 isoform X1 [Rana temporaria]
MGLSSAEKEGCRQMLFLMEVSDLLALYKTVSKTETPVRVKAEIIEKIIQESNNAEELLHRKRVYRHIIVQYLNNQHIFIYANSTKEKAIETVLHLWRKSDTSVNVECNTAASGSAVAQLSIQINGLSIQNSQEDSNPVDKAWLLAAGDAQVYQNDAAGISLSNVYKAAPRRTPQKSKAVPRAAAYVPSMTTFTTQTTDSNAFALLYASTSGTKPKVKPAPRKSQSTTVSVTVSVTSQQNSNGLSYATKGPRKQKQ